MSNVEDFDDEIISLEDDDESAKYRISVWGCLAVILDKYGIDVPNYITGTIGTHLAEDFMDMLCKTGYLVHKDGDEEE